MARQPDVAAEFVERFLEGGAATPDDIDALIRSRAPESVRLEYKGGDWLSKTGSAERGKPVKPGPRIAAWVSSFANTAGGVLVVGVDHDGVRRDLPHRVNAQTCGDWGADGDSVRQKATSALHGIAARHVVPPRITVVDHRDGMVLVVGVERAPDLIPCEDAGGAPLYYVRTLDGTTALADMVAADLLVGRRARPTFGLTAKLEQGNAGPQGFDLNVTLSIRNEGLVWVDDLRAGIVWRSAGCRDARLGLDPHLAREVDAPEPSCVGHVVAQEANYRWGALPPMAEVLTGPMVATHLGRIGTFSVGAYVVAKGHPPQWWQVDGRIERGQHGLMLAPRWDVAPCRGVRPRVAFVPEE